MSKLITSRKEFIMKLKKVFCSIFIMLILSLTILSLAVSADVANPMRIYSDSNMFRTYISGEFTPSYAATGSYGTTNGKHVEQIYVQAYENAWPNSKMEKATLKNTSVSSNTRQYTYYKCNYFAKNGTRKVNASDKTDSAECCFYGIGTLLQGYSTRYKVFCLKK